jgi:hypothetical protein
VKDPEIHGSRTLQTVQELEHAAALFRASNVDALAPNATVRAEEGLEGGRAGGREGGKEGTMGRPLKGRWKESFGSIQLVTV